MDKKLYEPVELEIIRFEVEDIITESLEDDETSRINKT